MAAAPAAPCAPAAGRGSACMEEGCSTRQAGCFDGDRRECRVGRTRHPLGSTGAQGSCIGEHADQAPTPWPVRLAVPPWPPWKCTKCTHRSTCLRKASRMASSFSRNAPMRSASCAALCAYFSMNASLWGWRAETWSVVNHRIHNTATPAHGVRPCSWDNSCRHLCLTHCCLHRRARGQTTGCVSMEVAMQVGASSHLRTHSARACL